MWKCENAERCLRWAVISSGLHKWKNTPSTVHFFVPLINSFWPEKLQMYQFARTSLWLNLHVTECVWVLSVVVRLFVYVCVRQRVWVASCGCWAVFFADTADDTVLPQCQHNKFRFRLITLACWRHTRASALVPQGTPTLLSHPSLPFILSSLHPLNLHSPTAQREEREGLCVTALPLKMKPRLKGRGASELQTWRTSSDLPQIGHTSKESGKKNCASHAPFLSLSIFLSSGGCSHICSEV